MGATGDEAGSEDKVDGVVGNDTVGEIATVGCDTTSSAGTVAVAIETAIGSSDAEGDDTELSAVSTWHQASFLPLPFPFALPPLAAAFGFAVHLLGWALP